MSKDEREINMIALQTTREETTPPEESIFITPEELQAGCFYNIYVPDHDGYRNLRFETTINYDDLFESDYVFEEGNERKITLSHSFLSSGSLTKVPTEAEAVGEVEAEVAPPFSLGSLIINNSYLLEFDDGTKIQTNLYNYQAAGDQDFDTGIFHFKAIGEDELKYPTTFYFTGSALSSLGITPITSPAEDAVDDFRGFDDPESRPERQPDAFELRFKKVCELMENYRECEVSPEGNSKANSTMIELLALNLKEEENLILVGIMNDRISRLHESVNMIGIL